VTIYLKNPLGVSLIAHLFLQEAQMWRPPVGIVKRFKEMGKVLAKPQE
jgi:hypothetical protein